MKIQRFDINKDLLTGLYKKHRNINKNEALFDEFKNIYYGDASKQIGKAKALKYYFENAKVYVSEYDIFADIVTDAPPISELRAEEHTKYKPQNDRVDAMIAEGCFFAGCDFGHTMPDWKIIMEEGFSGILEKAKGCMKNTGEAQKEFYQSVIYAYEGLISYVENLYKAASENEGENAEFVKSNLKNLMKKPPETLGEAMQLMFIYYTAQNFSEGEILRSIGGIDNLLFKYYKYELEHGTTEDEIREMIKYFLYKWSDMKILANIPFYLCGRGDEDVSEFTCLILDVYTNMDIYDPKIHIRCNERTPRDVYEIVMKSIRKGNNSFVFVNDSVVVDALVNIGISKEDAEDYTLIGCYEPSAAGKELPCTCNGAINMPVAVELVLNNGRKLNSDSEIGLKTGNIDEFDTFCKFYDAVKKQLKYLTDGAIEVINDIEGVYPEIIQAPLFSGTIEECMKKGIDAYAGGMKYNNSSICAMGVATLTDELIAIKKAVYEDKIISLSELKLLLENNWKDGMAVRQIMTKKYPKYGNNNDEADALACEIVEYMSGIINKHPNGRGGVYRMGLFSIDWRLKYGEMLGASADGRFAGEPISKNMCPSVGMDRMGVTAAINSAIKIDYSHSPDGEVIDLHIHPSVVSGDEGIEILLGILDVYLEGGGMAMQMNIVSAEKLRQAQREPDKYRNLQVRLCGWNVYFLDLQPATQDDMIKSMESA